MYDDTSTSASASDRGRNYDSHFDSSGRRYGTNISRPSLFPKICTTSSATSTPRRTRFFRRAPALASQWRLWFYFAAQRHRRRRADNAAHRHWRQQRDSLTTHRRRRHRADYATHRYWSTTAGSSIAFPMAVSATHATELVLQRPGFFWPSYHRLHNSNSHVAD